MPQAFDPVSLTADLIRCPSITPVEAGALDYLQLRLAELGFTCWRLPFSSPNTADVDNLFARLGNGEPHLCFAGHTDVVPPGDAAQWRHPPFSGHIADGAIYGRGASDMKGAIACFVAAVAQQKEVLKKGGSISLLITGDEEGPSVNGTEKVLPWMKDNNHVPTQCIVGEPTNPEQVGEMLKIGRRGFVSGQITVRGKAGHTAYMHLAKNPIPVMAKIIDALAALPLDEGSAFFQPSTLAFTTVDVGNSADNVIPGSAKAQFNIRFNDQHTRESLQQQIQNVIATILADTCMTYEFQMGRGAVSFITTPNPTLEMFEGAVQKVTGLSPERSTTGGTSDARFIRSLCPVFEFGLVNKTIHQINEHAKLADLEKLTAIYAQFLGDYFA